MSNRPTTLNQIITNAVVALLYVAVAKFGLSLASDPEQVTAVWPATGFALAVILRLGYSAWPGIAIGAVMANAITKEPIHTAVGIAVGNTLEAVAGAYLLRRFVGFRGTFERIAEVLGLTFFAAGLSTVISATIGTLSLCLSNVIPWNHAVHVWLLWWMGDAMGAIVVAPLLLTWTAPAKASPPPRILETGLFFAALVAVCACLFILPYYVTNQIKFFVWPFFVWAPMRLGQRITTTALLVVMLSALWGATHGAYSFQAETMNEKLLLLQGFMAIVSLSGLSLGAASAERAAARMALTVAARQLQAAHDEMEQRVKDRTAELEQAHVLLAEKRRELRDYIDNMSTFNAKVGTDGKILFAGRAAQIASGLSPEQIVGWDFLAGPWWAFDPIVAKRVREAFAKAVAGMPINYDEKACLYGNVILDISFSLVPIRDEKGVVQHVLAEGRDITALKAAEAKLRESETKLRLLLENVGDYAIYTLDAAGNVTSWNRGAERLKGYRADEVIGKNFSQFYVAEDAQSGRGEVALKAAAAQGSFEDEGWRVRKDGSRFWANTVMTPLRDASGEVYGFAKVTRDLSERKRAEDLLRRTNVDLERRVSERTLELQKAKDAADNANRAKDEFLAVVSHELRTPLTPVLGWTRMLRTHKLDEAHTAHALEVIERNVRTQSQLVEDLLDISRIITGKLRLNIRRIRLAAVIQSAIETVQPAADSKGIEIRADLADVDATVSCDADRLQQVVWNLLTNAIKFTPINGHVNVLLRRVESTMEISVQDDGEGVDPEFLPHMFNRFSQADSTTTRAHGGLGLGLAIVRHIVELHGGSVKADSKGVGQGAKFTVSLPLAPARANEPDSGKGSGWRAKSYGMGLDSLQNLRILVVDDELDTREFVAVTLQRCGAEVTMADSARAGLAHFTQHHPDILISDIGMPGEDGYSLIRKIRAHTREDGGCIPAIALTAYARPEDSTRILSEGFQIHVPKPIDPAELAAVVAKVAQRDGE